MEEPNKKLQDPDTLDLIMTPSPLLYDLIKKDAQAEIRLLKIKYAAVLRNCIMSRREKVLITLKNVVTKHLDLDEILIPLYDDDHDSDVEVEEEEEEEEEEEHEEKEDQIVRNKNKGIVINDTSEKTQGKAPMVVDTSDKSKGKAPMVVDTSDKSKGKAPMVVDTSEKTKGKEPLVDGPSEKSKGKAPMIYDTSEKTKGKAPMNDGTSEKAKGKAIMNDVTSEKSKGKAPIIDGSSEKSQGKAPVIVGTSEKSQGKETMILNDYSADKVLDKKPAKLAFKSGGITNIGYWYKNFSDEFASGKASKGNTPGSSGLVETTSHAEDVLEIEGLVEAGNFLKLGLGVNRIETTSYKKEVSNVPGLVQVRDSLKLGLRLNRNGVLSSEEMVVDYYETSEREEDFLKIENEDNLMSRKGNRDHKWENEGEMLLYLKTHRWLQLDAICALYRHERMIREQTTNRLTESNYQKITLLVEFLTNGSGHGPRARTLNELEEIYPGSTALSSWLVVTYANQLYRIYCNKSDLYFG